MLRCIGTLSCSLGLAGCTTFADVRSAEVIPGPQIDLGVTVSTPPGDETGWFWSFDCASECNHWIPGGNVALRYGHVPEAGGRPYELGAGISGTFPYATGYLQLARGPHPFGIGARVGIPVPGFPWREDALFARYDLSSGPTRWVFTPTAFLHSGNSPNRANPGWFVGLAPGLGWQQLSPGGTVTVSLVPVIGHTTRRRLDFGGYRWARETSVFLVAGLSIAFFRAR